MKVPKLTYSQITSGEIREIKKYYKLDDRQLEQHVRRHCNDAPREQMRNFYEEVYKR